MSGTILQTIVATKRREVEAAKRARPMAEVRAACAAAAPARDFYAAVAGARGLALIAEIKKASPSAGLIRADFEPAAIAREYEAAGANALSVLTDREYFQGELGFVAQVKAAAGLPVLRKDFVVDEYQVYESRAAGADAILLIAEILEAGQIDAWSAVASGLGMASLIEVHDEAQTAAVMPLVSPGRRAILGINNRDLHAQRTDIGVAQRIAKMLPAGTIFVAESGMKTREDVAAMAACGARGVLIGETFMRAADIGATVRELMGR